MPVKLDTTASMANSQEGHVAAAPPSATPGAPRDDSGSICHADDDGDTIAVVRAVLGALTAKRLTLVSDMIIAFVDKFAGEARGGRLYATTLAIIKVAVEDEIRSPLIARLCRKMTDQISDSVIDENFRDAKGQPIKGGLLFSKYLLNRCMAGLERGLSVQAQTAAAAKEKAEGDAAKKKSNEASRGQGGEEELYSDEYYAAQKARRRSLGHVRFIGELFKLQMLTEQIMLAYIKKLLSSVETTDEEKIESICKLLSTVGPALDRSSSKARSQMDAYFKRMRDLSDSPNIDSGMKLMLRDVIELRGRKWVPQNTTTAPATVSAGHDQPAKECAAAGKETASRMSTTSHRGGSKRGDNRSDYGPHAGADGRSTPASRVPASKAGAPSQSGKTNKPVVGSVFAGKKGATREHTSSKSINPFAALTQNPGENAADAPSTSRSRKPSVDFSQSGLSEGGGRRKLQLLPRTKPLEVSATPEKTETPEESEDENAAPTPDEDEPPKKVLSEAQIKKQIEEDTKEFFAVRKLDESEQYFESLPEDQRHRLVDAVFTRALDGKEAEATLSGNLFALVLEKGKVTPDILEKGFSGPIEFLDDIAVDAPAAYALTAKILHLSKFDEARVRRLAEKIAVDGDPLVAPKDKLLKEFRKLSS